MLFHAYDVAQHAAAVLPSGRYVRLADTEGGMLAKAKEDAV
jgi:hypothetical protein